jgi:hypothetical protein
MEKSKVDVEDSLIKPKTLQEVRKREEGIQA